MHREPLTIRHVAADEALPPFGGPRKLLAWLEGLHFAAATVALLWFGLPYFVTSLGQMSERFRQVGGVSTDQLNRAAFGLLCIAYAVGTWYSALCLRRHVGRAFSIRWAWAHLVTGVGTPLSLLTWLVLTRESVKQVYACLGVKVVLERVLLPNPAQRPPLPVLPIPAIPLEVETLKLWEPSNCSKP